MKFYININEDIGDGVTVHCVDTESDCPIENKKQLSEYFIYMGVAAIEVDSVLERMGFVGKALEPGPLKTYGESPVTTMNKQIDEIQELVNEKDAESPPPTP